MQYSCIGDIQRDLILALLLACSAKPAMCFIVSSTPFGGSTHYPPIVPEVIPVFANSSPRPPWRLFEQHQSPSSPPYLCSQQRGSEQGEGRWRGGTGRGGGREVEGRGDGGEGGEGEWRGGEVEGREGEGSEGEGGGGEVEAIPAACECY